MIQSHVIAVGHYLPERVVSNHDLPESLNTSDEWIRTRTGIEQRHIAAEGQLTSDLAAEAAKRALEKGGIAAAEVDLIIVATTTPDETFPATSTRVQAKIGAKTGAAFDLQAACSGFVYGVSVADGMLRTGQAKTALVIGAETYSRIVDWNDRSTCILFGDGAGALLLQAKEEVLDKPQGVLAARIYADGSYGDILKTTGGVSLTQNAGIVTMQGKEVFRHAVQNMSDATMQASKAASIELSAVDWVIPHQANTRIINAIAEKLSLPTEKVISSVNKHANTSAASIPLAWSVSEEEGTVKSGDLLALPALGAGLTWGCCIIRR